MTASSGFTCLGLDHVHFYVDHLEVWGCWFQECWGFQLRGYRQTPASHSLWLSQGLIHLVLSASQPGSTPDPEAETIRRYRTQHPQGIAEVALRIDQADRAYTQLKADHQSVQWHPQASQHHPHLILELPLGNTDTPSFRHSLIERIHPLDESNPILPGFEVVPGALTLSPPLFSHIDHLVLNVSVGLLAPLVTWYQRIGGWSVLYECQIETQHSGLKSKVVGDPGVNPVIQLAINEPIGSSSQIQTFIEANHGSGIQHLAFYTPEILTTVPHLRQQGIPFLTVPDDYYQALEQSHTLRDPDLLTAIRTQQLLLDQVTPHRPDQQLLQIFTEPLFPEPTLFFELIQRYGGATGFGDRNFRALFKAIESYQSDPLSVKTVVS